MDKGNGDGDDYVSYGEFRGCMTRTNKSLDRINLALWGSEGATGIVGSLHEMKTRGKMWDRIITLALAVLGSVITAFIIGGIN